MNSDATPKSTKSLLPEADLHCHILPDWDDGPRTLDESLRMAQRAQMVGLKRILVTPHVGRQLSRPIPHSNEIPGAVVKLQKEIDDAGIDITLVPGAELSITLPEIVERVAVQPWLTVAGGGKYILLESPFAHWPDFGEHLHFQISLKGVVTIIAHPERYLNIQKDISLIEKAVTQGALLQITARSLLTPSDRPIYRTSMTMLERGMISVIASDLHTDAGAHLPDVVDVVVKTVGESEARRILIDNPRRILAGEHVSAPAVRPAPPKIGLIGSLMSRVGRKSPAPPR
jgi:protein-tyrosine phosphatase